MKRRIENFLAKCVCKGIELYMRKYRIYMSNDELIPMTDEQFKEELINHKTENSANTILSDTTNIEKVNYQRVQEYREGTNSYVLKM